MWGTTSAARAGVERSEGEGPERTANFSIRPNVDSSGHPTARFVRPPYGIEDSLWQVASNLSTVCNGANVHDENAPTGQCHFPQKSQRFYFATLPFRLMLA
ncbi:hypothetical protein Poly41_33050 [Novipirellula artificiosorum]|uniref:Uncharacterized protein n=1 Tax=Novipirellula artificiosorum TaxID=2528016 RepID=A0A5C6DK99_9BACT|nr:hypothetical protein Poly41_33050 [Novipirellula artificiosorum]